MLWKAHFSIPTFHLMRFCPFLFFWPVYVMFRSAQCALFLFQRGKKNIAPILGFFEVLIWIIAISKIMQNLDNYVNYVAYAAGFATGNFVGMIIEEKLAMGIQMIRVFTSEKGMELVKTLNNNGFGATTVEAHGAKEKIHLVYSIVHRNELEKVLEVINSFNPRAFFTIEDVKAVNEGIFNPKKQNSVFPFRKYNQGMEEGEVGEAQGAGQGIGQGESSMISGFKLLLDLQNIQMSMDQINTHPLYKVHTIDSAMNSLWEFL